MSKPTHVYVGVPCPDCKEYPHLEQKAITLEEFAAMFTYDSAITPPMGTVRVLSDGTRVIEHEKGVITTQENRIFVRAPEKRPAK